MWHKIAQMLITLGANLSGIIFNKLLLFYRRKWCKIMHFESKIYVFVKINKKLVYEYDYYIAHWSIQTFLILKDFFNAELT